MSPLPATEWHIGGRVGHIGLVLRPRLCIDSARVGRVWGLIRIDVAIGTRRCGTPMARAGAIIVDDVDACATGAAIGDAIYRHGTGNTGAIAAGTAGLPTGPESRGGGGAGGDEQEEGEDGPEDHRHHRQRPSASLVRHTHVHAGQPIGHGQQRLRHAAW